MTHQPSIETDHFGLGAITYNYLSLYLEAYITWNIV